MPRFMLECVWECRWLCGHGEKCHTGAVSPAPSVPGVCSGSQAQVGMATQAFPPRCPLPIFSKSTFPLTASWNALDSEAKDTIKYFYHNTNCSKSKASMSWFLVTASRFVMELYCVSCNGSSISNNHNHRQLYLRKIVNELIVSSLDGSYI